MKSEIDRILEALKQLKESDRRLREADERHARDARQADERQRAADERHARDARQADERLHQELDRIGKELDRTGKEIDRLTGSIGNFQGELLEPIAASYVMHVLSIKDGLDFREPLEATILPCNGASIEVDLCGRARRNGSGLLVLGEVKRSCDVGDVAGFDFKTAPIVRRRRGGVLRLLFCLYVDAYAEREARRRGIRILRYRRWTPRA